MESISEKRKLSDDSSGISKKQATNQDSSRLNPNASASLPISVQMNIPYMKIRPLIGTNGNVLREICKQSRCKVQMKPAMHSGLSRTLVLTGDSMALGIAVELVARVLEVDTNAIPEPNYASILLSGSSSSQQAPADEEMLGPSYEIDLEDISMANIQLEDSPAVQIVSAVSMASLLAIDKLTAKRITRESHCNITVNGSNSSITYDGTMKQITMAQLMVKAFLDNKFDIVEGIDAGESATGPPSPQSPPTKGIEFLVLRLIVIHLVLCIQTTLT